MCVPRGTRPVSQPSSATYSTGGVLLLVLDGLVIVIIAKVPLCTSQSFVFYYFVDNINTVDTDGELNSRKNY